MSMNLVNTQVLLASRPAGEATVDNFRLVQTPVPALPTARCWCATTT
jgi:NADPH-dependent curcumin reductase CurA